MLNSSQDIDLQSLLLDPDAKLEDILLSNDFTNLWALSDPNLFSFLIRHYGELIDTGFQIRDESDLSIRCLQVISSNNPFFRHRFFKETYFLNFVYNYIFNISTFPEFSQKNYFYVLPNVIVDQFKRLEPTFNEKYFTELFNNIQNDFAYNFILRLINFGPTSFEPVLKEIKICEKIVLNIIQYLSIQNQKPDEKLLLIRNQNIFKAIINSKFDDGACSVLNDHIDEIIKNSIQNPNSIVFSFLQYIDEFSMNSFSLSKWHKIHQKIIPHLSEFCDIVLNSKIESFTSLSESCTLLAIGITTTTKDVSPCFINLYERLLMLFFEFKTNSFLHNCFLKVFNLLLSFDLINASFLDEYDIFGKIMYFYENRDISLFASFWGHLYLISKEIDQFAQNSKTVDLEKWNQIVIEKNKLTEKILNNTYGGFVPPDLRVIKTVEPVNDSFFAKNLFITIIKTDKENHSPLS